MSLATLLAEMAGVDVEEARRREEAHDDHSAMAESFSDMVDRRRNLVDRVVANQETKKIENHQDEQKAQRGTRTETITKHYESSDYQPKGQDQNRSSQTDQGYLQSKPARSFTFPQGNAPKPDKDQGMEM